MVGLLPTSSKLVDGDGVEIEVPLASPTFPAGTDGAPLDGVFAGGSGSANGDILWSLDTTLAKAVALHWPVPGTGATCAIEGTYNGTSWFGLIVYRLGAPGISFQAVSALGGQYAVNVNGCVAVRCRITAAGSGGAITGLARTLSAQLSEAMTAQQASTSVLAAATVIGSAVSVSSARTNLCSLNLLNTQASARYVHFYNNTGATGTAVITVGIPANGSINLAYPGRGISFSAGLSYKVTTDDAGTTGATAGDVIGTVGYGL